MIEFYKKFSFKIQERKEKVGINPKTKEKVKISARNVIKFKVSKNILNKIDKNCFKNLYFHKDISSMLFEGLAYRGIVYLLKERIERDEKI